MTQLAIKGHATRGEEVIKILEMLGGNNKYAYVADSDCFAFYIGNETGNIYYDWVHSCYEDEGTLVFTLEEFLEKFPYKVGDKVQHKGATSCGTVYVIERMEWANNHIEYEIRPLYDYNHTGLVTVCADELQPYKEETMDKANKAVFDVNAQCCDIMNRIIKEKAMEEIKIDIPKGYEFAGVDDDKQQVVFTKIGYHYPNTYEECCDVLKIPNDERYIDIDVPLGYNKLLSTFTKLLVCRNAYWKIAGDWKPDLEDVKPKYGLIVVSNRVKKQKSEYVQIKFCFPTEEMCDAFYENFNDLIEQCKELL